MSKTEIVLIFLVALIPIVALFILLPKTKKDSTPKEKEKPAPKEPKAEAKAEQPKPKLVETDPNEFKGYLQEKQAEIKVPEVKEPPKEFEDKIKSFHFDDFDDEAIEVNREKTLAEQINDLSPELKAILFSNALKGKDDK